MSLHHESKHDYHLLDDDLEAQNQRNHQEKWDVLLRLGFIRKVYGILSIQLLATTFMCFLSMASTSFFQFQLNNIWLFIFAMLLTLILPCFVFCFSSLLKEVPKNYIFLGVFTLCESYLVSFICGMTNPGIVFMAAFMTFAMVLALTLYAATTKSDFTMMGGLLFVFGMGIFLLSFCAMFTNNKFVHIFISCLCVVLFGIYLVYDTQLILGNKELRLSIDDYILASFMLYTDIIGLFLNLLQILSLLSSNE